MTENKKHAIEFLNALLEESQNKYNSSYIEQDILLRIQEEKAKKEECDKEIVKLREDLAGRRLRKALTKEARELLKEIE